MNVRDFLLSPPIGWRQTGKHTKKPKWSAYETRQPSSHRGPCNRCDTTPAWTPDAIRDRPAPEGGGSVLVNGIAVDPNGPSLFTTLQEQLGLKLTGAKGPVEVIVIDSVQKPTAN